MHIYYTLTAQAAFNAADLDTQRAANSALAEYSAYANRHALPARGTLKRISAAARATLRLPAGTPVFERGAGRHA